MYLRPLILSIAVILLATTVYAQAPLTDPEIAALLSGKNESGVVIEPSGNDIGPAGTVYGIRYRKDGSLVYRTTAGAEGTGWWRISEGRLCRGFGQQDGSPCRRIVERGDGYAGIGFRTGTLRYRFTVLD